MTLEAAAAIGELVGGIAVLVTIVYLARQVTQASHQNAAAARASIAQHRADIVLPLLADRALTEALVLRQAGEVVDPVDAFRVGELDNAVLRWYEQIAWAQHDGLLEEDLWLSYRSNLKWNASHGSLRAIAEQVAANHAAGKRTLFSARFAELLGEVLAEADEQGLSATARAMFREQADAILAHRRAVERPDAMQESGKSTGSEDSETGET